MAFTQGVNPDYASQYVNFHRFHSLYSMLRCRYFLSWKDKHLEVADTGVSMPRLLLVQDWMLIPKRNDIFKAMQNPTFDIYKTITLENTPNPMPEKPAQQGMVDSSTPTHHLTIEAELSSPAILLVTDVMTARDGVRGLCRQAHNRSMKSCPLIMFYEPCLFQKDTTFFDWSICLWDSV